MAGPAPLTMVETRELLSATRKLTDETDRTLLIDYLAHNPTGGDLIPGTGGVRTLRWALEGRGKSGGARIIYLSRDTAMPIYALTAYAENERADLSQQDRNDVRRLTRTLGGPFRRRHA